MQRSFRVANMMAAALVRSARLTAGSRANDRLVSLLPRRSLPLDDVGYSVSYLESGAPEGMPVVFVHGTPGEASMWVPYLSSVPNGFQYVAIDRPGYGDSGPDGAVPLLSEQAQSVSAVVRAQQAGPAILVGHSVGGPVIAQVAIDAPSEVAALIMLGAPFDPALENTRTIQRAIDNWPAHLVLPRRLRNANRELLLLKAELEALEGSLPRIRAPVIILHGTKDDLIPISNVEFLKARLTGSRRVTTTLLEGHGHFLPVKSKSSVLAAISMAAASDLSP